MVWQALRDGNVLERGNSGVGMHGGKEEGEWMTGKVER